MKEKKNKRISNVAELERSQLYKALLLLRNDWLAARAGAAAAAAAASSLWLILVDTYVRYVVGT